MIAKLRYYFLLPAMIISIGIVYGQEEPLNSVRVSGIVVDADDHEAVPYVNISIAGTMYGSAADNSGYFSLFINPGDTLLFSSIGYREAVFIMPYDISSSQYSLVQLMRKETVELEEVVVFPWPTIEHFEKAFLEVEPEPGMNELIFEVKRGIKQMADEAELNEYYYDQMRYNRLYQLHGKIPPNNFLNPFRWVNFIRDVTNGTYDNEENE